MTLDLLGCLAITLGAFGGWPSGAAHQVLRLVVVVGAAIAGRMVVVPIAGFFLRMTGAEPETAVGICYLLACAVAGGALWLALEGISNRVRDAQHRSQIDRFSGALVGAVKGAAFAFVIAVGLATISAGSGRPALDYEDSQLGTWALERNFLAGASLTVLEQDMGREQLEVDGWERR